jgi:hypothetical protein
VNAGRGVRLLDDAELPREVRGLERQRGTQWPGPGCETPSLPPRTGAPVVLAERFCARKTRLRLKKPDETVHGRPIDHRPRLRLQISLQVGVDRPRQWPSHHASCTRHPVCAGPGATDSHRWRRDARRSGGYDASCRTPTTDPAPPGRPGNQSTSVIAAVSSSIRGCDSSILKEGSMRTGLTSARTLIALVAVPFLSAACQGSHPSSGTAPSTVDGTASASMSQPGSTTAAQTPGAAGQTQASVVPQGSMNGAAGQMPAYYDGNLFTVNMKEMPDMASDSTIGKNPSLNEIYAYADLDEEQPFVPVIDAIQGEGFNPLWRQILITFNTGFTPRQFTSEDEIDAAAAGPNPEITLVETDEVYRCSVVGSK